jgi:hypothetical protein
MFVDVTNLKQNQSQSQAAVATILIPVIYRRESIVPTWRSSKRWLYSRPIPWRPRRATSLVLRTERDRNVPEPRGSRFRATGDLVHRLLNPLGFAAGQLAVFQGASEAPLSES